MKPTLRSSIAVLSLAFLVTATAARGDLLVYESFAYPPDLTDAAAGALDGKNAGIGFGGAWEDMTTGSNNGEGFIFDSNGNTNGTNDVDSPGTPQPDWDGSVANLPQLGNYVGLSPFNNTQFEDRNNSRRTLAQSAGDMAGTDGILWMSMAVHFPFPGFQIIPGLMLTDGGGFSERSRDITDGSTGIGVGHGSAWGLDLNAITYNAGAFDTRTNVSDLSYTQDSVIVLKFQFGDVADTVSTWAFSEDQSINEIDFDANALSTTSTFNIDEDTLTTLAVGFTRALNAYDEIRIGDTFADIISLPAPGAVHADISTVEASPVNVNADGASTSTITVTLRDAVGFPIPGKTVSLANTAPPGTPVITPVSPVTDVNGEATFTVSSAAPGTEEFAATNTTDALLITQTATVGFVGPTDAGLSTVEASPADVQADGASTSTITVILLDSAGLPVQGNSVSLANTAGPGTPTITPVSPVSDADGVATFTVSSGEAGIEEFTATDTTDAVVISQTASVVFVGVVDADESTVEASPSTVVADGAATSTITVTLKDAGGFAVAGKDVTLANTAGPMAATIDTTLAKLSDANGQVTFTVSSSTIGTEVFTATDETDALTITQTASVEFVDAAVQRAFNVNFEQFTPSIVTPEVESTLEGPAGGLGTRWNQFADEDSTGSLVDSTGVSTSFAFTTDFSECRSGGGGNTPMLRSTLTDFGRGQSRTLTMTGLVPNTLYDVWLASFRDSIAAVERTVGVWSTANPTTSPSSQTIDNRDGRNGTTFVEGYNYVVFENVQADGTGQIVLDGKGATVADGFDADYRLGLSGFQVEPAPPARIVSFEAAGAVGVIDQGAGTIDIEVPFGTDLATLAPTFVLNSGTCDQVSGSPPSPTFAMSNPVDYVVTDTSTDPDTVNTYSVTVTVANETGTIVINLGSGTTIPGGAFGTFDATNLPLPPLPAGSILKSIDVDTTLAATDNDNFANELALLFDPTPGTPDDTTFTLIITSGTVVFGTTTETIPWAGGGSGPPTPLMDSKTEADWAAVAPIDLGTTGLLLGNSYDADTGEALQGGTWAGTITLTYEVTAVASDYDSWAGGFGLDPLTDGATGANPDGDRYDNGHEYAFALDPTAASTRAIHVPLDHTTGTFSYTRRDPALTGLTYTYEFSTNLESGNWTVFTPDSEVPTGTPDQEVVVMVPAALLANPDLYVRVVATP